MQLFEIRSMQGLARVLPGSWGPLQGTLLGLMQWPTLETSEINQANGSDLCGP